MYANTDKKFLLFVLSPSESRTVKPVSGSNGAVQCSCTVFTLATRLVMFHHCFGEVHSQYHSQSQSHSHSKWDAVQWLAIARPIFANVSVGPCSCYSFRHLYIHLGI